MIRQVLVQAKKMIEKPEAWVKGWPCGLRDGDSFRLAFPDDPDEANCYCASFAIARSAGSADVALKAEAALIDAVAHLFGGSYGWISHFNDSRHTTHEMVMQAFDAAIEAA